MFHKKPLASAISSITALGALGAGMAAPAYAEESDQPYEEVVVTGSRIPTAVSDAPRPITVLDRTEIELSGYENVADVLRTTTFNSLGSFRERSGSSFQQIALIDLRGLGPDRTAVLINGRRVPGNPLTGTSAVDLNSIPLSAVDSIEILTDSASAIYGADAIGGVINVKMKEEYVGAEFEIGGERPEADGADSDHFNITFGAAGDRASVLFSAEWYKRNPIFDADRDYSQVQVSPSPDGGLPRHGVDTVGVSSGGNTLFETNFGDAFPGGPCPTDRYIPVQEPEGIPGASGCGFGYADISMQTGGIDRKSSFLNAAYEINEDHKIYFENRYSDLETFGRYAPAVGFFLVDEEAPLNPTLGTEEQRDLFLFHRFVGHGNRDDSLETSEVDSVLGLQGAFMDGRINYDVYARYYEYTSQEKGDTYVIASIIEDLVADGSYNFVDPLDPDNAGAIQQSAATLFRDIKTEYTAGGLTLDGTMPVDLGAGEIGWAFGGEVASEEYKDEYDAIREAGNALGSAGNSSAGDRSRWASFFELEVPLLDSLQVNVAVRYDDYDDFGTEFSPQVAVRFQPLDMLTLRASWGEGFKAPNLGDLYQELSQSFETITDLLRCESQGIAEADCTNSQVEEYTGGNPELEPEQSESWNFGVVLEPIDGLSLSVDYFSIEIDDAVETLDLQDVLDLERQGALPSGVIVNRAPTNAMGELGVITNCVGGVQAPNCGIINVFGNLAALEIEGIDFRGNYELDTDIGMFMFSLDWSHMKEYDEQPTPNAEVIDRPGTRQYPENRANAGIRYQAADFTVNYTYRWIDEHDGVTAAGKYDDYSTHDITFVWHTPWEGDLSFGVLNVGDEDPVIDSASGYDDEVTLELYSVTGRTPFLSYKHSF